MGVVVLGAEVIQGFFAGTDLADSLPSAKHWSAGLIIEGFMIEPKPLEYAGHGDRASPRMAVADLDRNASPV